MPGNGVGAVKPRKYQGFGLVRDKNGVPRIDGDPKDLDPRIQVMLTKEERRERGLWDHPWIRDAQGFKRVKRLDADRIEVVDDIVAAGSLIEEGKEYRIEPRRDFAAGTVFTCNVRD